MMMKIMLAAAIFTAAVLAARLLCYRRQIESLLSQMSLLEQEDTNYCLSSCCQIGRTGELIDALNRILQKNREQAILLGRRNRRYRESIAGISHDIRTPLTSAKGYTQMLLKGAATEEKQRRYIAKTDSRIDEVVELLDQLFEYVRAEMGEYEFQSERINLTNLFADTLSLFYEDFIRAGCEPEVTADKSPLFIEADADAMKRILENLIKNALVHGKGAYRFSLERQKNNAVITVSNQTDSIEKSDMEHIFHHFYTTEQSRTRKAGGLGLAIVKQFTEEMGGKVEADLKDCVFSIKAAFPAVGQEQTTGSF